MKVESAKKKVTDEEYYDKRGVLGEIVESEVALSLDDALRQDILSGKRKRKLRNITVTKICFQNRGVFRDERFDRA